MLFETYLGEFYNINKENIQRIEIRNLTKNTNGNLYSVFVILNDDAICFATELTSNEAKKYAKDLAYQINSRIFVDRYKEKLVNKTDDLFDNVQRMMSKRFKNIKNEVEGE